MSRRTANTKGDGVGQRCRVEPHAHGGYRHVSIWEPPGHQYEAFIQPPLQAAGAHRRQRQLQIGPPPMKASYRPACAAQSLKDVFMYTYQVTHDCKTCMEGEKP